MNEKESMFTYLTYPKNDLKTVFSPRPGARFHIKDKLSLLTQLINKRGMTTLPKTTFRFS